jgi:L-lactate utilization protein LutC
LTSLVKKIDEATIQNADKRMGSFVVMLSDDDTLEGKLKELAEEKQLKKVVLTIDNPAGPDGFNISKDADVTVVLYVKKKVVKSLAYEKGQLDDKAIQEVVASVAEILP